MRWGRIEAIVLAIYLVLKDEVSGRGTFEYDSGSYDYDSIRKIIVFLFFHKVLSERDEN